MRDTIRNDKLSDFYTTARCDIILRTDDDDDDDDGRMRRPELNFNDFLPYYTPPNVRLAHVILLYRGVA